MLGFNAKIAGALPRARPRGPRGTRRWTLRRERQFRARFSAKNGTRSDPGTPKSVSVRKDPGPLFSIS